MLVPLNNLPHIGNEFEAMLVWMHEQPAEASKSYFIHTSSMVPGVLRKSDIKLMLIR